MYSRLDDPFYRFKKESFTKPIAFLNLNSRIQGLVHSGPPLGLMALMGLCRHLNIPFGFIEADALNMSVEEVSKAITKGGFAYVGLTLVSLNAVTIFPILQRIKELTGSTIIVGGPLPTIDTEWLMESCPAVDYAVIGEGETVLPSLLLTFQGKGPLDDITGLAYRVNGEIVIQPRAEEFPAYNLMPRPAFESVDFFLYPGALPVGAWPCAHIMAIRGCPYNCTFCCNMWRRKPEALAVTVLLDWLHYLVSRGVKEVFFIDDTLNINADWFEQLCQGITRQGLNKDLRFKGLFRADLTTKKQLSMARQAGFWIIFIGAEAGTDEMLKYYRKSETLEDISAAIEAMRSVPGLKSFAGFIAGAPIDTRETLTSIANFIKETDPTYGLIQVLHPFIGATIAEDIISRGILTRKEIREYDHHRHTIHTETLSTQDLLQLVDFIRNDIFEYKISSERRKRRQRELLPLLQENNTDIDLLIACEESEAKEVLAYGVPQSQLFDKNCADLSSLNDTFCLALPDNRISNKYWHESEKTFRWSKATFKVPFFLHHERRILKVEWASMRHRVEVVIVIDDTRRVLTYSVDINDLDWHIDSINLLKPLKDAVWVTFNVREPFFAQNDTRELGMAVKKIFFIA